MQPGSKQPKSVFKTLLKTSSNATHSSKQATHRPDSSAGKRTRAYEQCPLCGRSIPSYFLETHASSCKPQEPIALPAPTPTTKSAQPATCPVEATSPASKRQATDSRLEASARAAAGTQREPAETSDTGLPKESPHRDGTPQPSPHTSAPMQAHAVQHAHPASAPHGTSVAGLRPASSDVFDLTCDGDTTGKQGEVSDSDWAWATPFSTLAPPTQLDTTQLEEDDQDFTQSDCVQGTGTLGVGTQNVSQSCLGTRAQAKGKNVFSILMQSQRAAAGVHQTFFLEYLGPLPSLTPNTHSSDVLSPQHTGPPGGSSCHPLAQPLAASQALQTQHTVVSQPARATPQAQMPQSVIGTGPAGAPSQPWAGTSGLGEVNNHSGGLSMQRGTEGYGACGNQRAVDGQEGRPGLLGLSLWRWHWWNGKGPSAAASAAAGVDTHRIMASSVWSATTGMKEPRAGGPAKAPATLHLHTNVHPGAGGPVNWEQMWPSNCRGGDGQGGAWRGAPSALKSCLQKAVRLGSAGPAARMALQFLKDGEASVGELLRRLPVISLEDSITHPALPLVVWLMASQSKGYQLGVVHAAAVLQFVYEMSAVKVRDYLPRLTSLPVGFSSPSLAGMDEILKGHPQEAALVKSMLLRASYGGMQCDVAMLRGYAQYWTLRFLGQSAGPPPAPTPPPVTPAAVPVPAPAAPTPDMGSLPSSGFVSATQVLAHTQMPEGEGRGEAGEQEVRDSAVQVPGDGEGVQLGEEADEKMRQCQGAAAESPWLSYLHAAHACARPPSLEALQPSCMGPLKRSDLPLSGIDFHVSDVMAALLAMPQVSTAAEALTQASWGAEGDPEQCLRSAMWLFRSCLNNREWLQVTPVPGCPNTYEQDQLKVDTERDEAQKDRLSPLWSAAAVHADRFSAHFIARRFQIL